MDGYLSFWRNTNNRENRFSSPVASPQSILRLELEISPIFLSIPSMVMNVELKNDTLLQPNQFRIMLTDCDPIEFAKQNPKTRVRYYSWISSPRRNPPPSNRLGHIDFISIR